MLAWRECVVTLKLVIYNTCRVSQKGRGKQEKEQSDCSIKTRGGERTRQAAWGRASWVWSCSLPSAVAFAASLGTDAVASQQRLRNCPECNYGNKEKWREIM